MLTREKLIQQIEYHDKKYWQDNSPEISDEKYDELIESLRLIDPDHPLINKVHSATTGSVKKIKHAKPMLSLDKVYNDTALFKWMDKVSRGSNEKFRIEPKLDGLSASKINNQLATRGDGEYGEDITDKMPIIMVDANDYTGSITKDPVNTRKGEIVIRKDMFNKMKGIILRDNGEPYKYERAMVAGLINRDDIKDDLTAILTFVDFNQYSIIDTDANIRNYNWQKMLNDLKEWEFPTDGMVIKLDDEHYSHSLGYTSHHPRGQIAYKHANPSATSKLLKVIWSAGKNKKTPVGIIEPVTIANAIITKVSLSNAKNIIDKDININDMLTIERAGEIIPYVVKVQPSQDRKPILIDYCPDCGTQVIYSEPDIICPNIDCSGTLSKRLTDSVARLGFEYLAGATINKLIDIGIENLIDILLLTPDDIYQLEGFADRSTQKLYDEIQRIRTYEMEDWKFVSALNIKGIGKRVSRKILETLTLDELIEANIDRLVLIDGIGIERAIDITEYFNKNKTFVNRLRSLLNVIRKETSSNKLVCFTGKADRPRNELNQIAESKGLLPTNTISNELSILVTNNINSNSTKMKKARNKPTIQIITYEQFYDL